MNRLLNRLLGCAWGVRVGFAHDRTPCPEQATQRMALHDGEHTIYVQVCDLHHHILLEDTKGWCPHGPA